MNLSSELVLAEEVALEYPTYPVGQPEKHPLFFEKRVYQGSNGKVYPLPFIDKLFDVPQVRRYRAIRLENQFVRVVLLPDFGGPINAIQDKTNQDYDILYHQKVLKPALVGLAGPWLSGGIEFNWPQHHRPGTFMPADWAIERSDDGSVTAWMSEHDPLNRLKGMHGVRLTPNSALIELRIRLFNRTPYLQTFLWWANAAVKVHAASANEAQDKEMAVTSYSPFTYYRGLSLLAWGRDSEAYQLFSALCQHGQQLQQLPGKIDYFATSLPNMLVFEDDLTQRNLVEGKFLEGLALLQLCDVATARACFREVLDLDPSHYEATDQLRALNVLTA